MQQKHYLSTRYTKAEPSDASIVQASPLYIKALSVVAVSLLSSLSCSSGALAYEYYPDNNAPKPAPVAKFRPADATPRFAPAQNAPVAPVRQAPAKAAPAAGIEGEIIQPGSTGADVDGDSATEDLSATPEQFSQIAQPQSTPALNVVTPPDRPPIPSPPQVALPPIVRADFKAPQNWRIKANNLFKTAPDKTKIQVFFNAPMPDTINSLVQAFTQQGFKVSQVNARSGHMLVLVDNFVQTGNGPIESTAGSVSGEKIIIAVRTDKTPQDCEIRILVEPRNRTLTVDRVHQIVDQMQSVGRPVDEML